MPTRSSCSTRAASSSTARTKSCSRSTAATRTSSISKRAPIADLKLRRRVGASLGRARVRADQTIHAEDSRLDGGEEVLHRQAGRELRVGAQREQPEVVVVHA